MSQTKPQKMGLKLIFEGIHLLNLPSRGPKAKTVEIRNLKSDFNLSFANIPSSITLLIQ
jgi:hypothetical protein